MFLNMKNSFSLFELILTLAISTTIIIYSTLLVKDLIILNKTSLSKELARLELNSTKIFIEKNKNELNKFGLNKDAKSDLSTRPAQYVAPIISLLFFAYKFGLNLRAYRARFVG